jgi:hypothetical protein
MDAMATGATWDLSRLWKRYRGAISVSLTCLALVLFYWTVSRTAQRGINNFLQDYQGGTDYGFSLATSDCPSPSRRSSTRS